MGAFDGQGLTTEQGSTLDEKVDATLDRLLVEFGKEILSIVPGRVSTEVDAALSFDVQGSIKKALHIIEVSSLSILLWPSTDLDSSSTNPSASIRAGS